MNSKFFLYSNHIFCLIYFHFFLLISCSSKGQNLEKVSYLYLDRSGEVDTINRIMTHNFLKDSTFHCAYINYFGLRGNSSTDTTAFVLPVNTDTIDYIWLGDIKRFYSRKRTYLIYKYQLDIPEGDDEEMLFFYNPEFGILIDKSIWGNYTRLFHTNSIPLNQTAFYLCDKIISDEDFFCVWKW